MPWVASPCSPSDSPWSAVSTTTVRPARPAARIGSSSGRSAASAVATSPSYGREREARGVGLGRRVRRVRLVDVDPAEPGCLVLGIDPGLGECHRRLAAPLLLEQHAAAPARRRSGLRRRRSPARGRSASRAGRRSRRPRSCSREPSAASRGCRCRTESGSRRCRARRARSGRRPERMLACDASVVTLCACASEKRTPAPASRSIHGVAASALPYAPSASARSVSTVTSRTLRPASRSRPDPERSTIATAVASDPSASRRARVREVDRR